LVGSRAAHGRPAPALSIETSIYLDILVRGFTAFGGGIVTRRFETLRDLMTLTELAALVDVVPLACDNGTRSKRMSGGFNRQYASAGETPLMGHDPDGHVHTQRVALSCIGLEVVLVVAFPLPTV